MKHRTAPYIFNRIKQWIYFKKHRDQPWLTPDSIRLLEQLICANDIGIEFGSGRSTQWFASRLNKLYSVEGNKKWFDRISKTLENLKVENVDYRYVPNKNESGKHLHDYLSVFDSEVSGFDFILVDGIYRADTALQSLSYLKPGGILVVDNCNWVLPSESKSPSSIRTYEEMEPKWRKFYDSVSEWRSIWTSNGVTDTVIFIKP